MNMTDEELDRDWKPNGRRPQSTIARSFSQELMDIFRIENSVADLDEQVDKRKQNITTQTAEIEALEARIREMEKRLKQGNGPPTSATASSSKEPTSPRSQRLPVTNVFANNNNSTTTITTTDAAAAKNGSRPGTARQHNQQAVPGQLPPTPVASEDGDGPQDA